MFAQPVKTVEFAQVGPLRPQFQLPRSAGLFRTARGPGVVGVATNKGKLAQRESLELS